MLPQLRGAVGVALAPVPERRGNGPEFCGQSRNQDLGQETSKQRYLPFFRCGPPHVKHPPPSSDLPPAFTGAVPPNPPVGTVVSWSSKCVYFVRLRFPKFLTCMTFGSMETSTTDSVASV